MGNELVFDEFAMFDKLVEIAKKKKETIKGNTSLFKIRW